MDYVDIVIPTRNRLKTLLDTIDSIPQEDWIRIKVVCDGDRDTFRFLRKKLRGRVEPFLIESHSGAVTCRNHVTAGCEDGVLYGTDDIVFAPNVIEQARIDFNNLILDDDGVLGFVQEPYRFHPTGVGLVGQTFLRRYPMKWLFCPYYYHFACQEIHWLATKLGKFYQSQEALVYHYTPTREPDKIDRTHTEARRYKDYDTRIKKVRRQLGVIWGDQNNG